MSDSRINERSRTWTVRLAGMQDVPALLAVYRHARAFMRSYGNYAQWVGGYPSEKDLAKDIGNGSLYIVEGSSPEPEDGRKVQCFSGRIQEKHSVPENFPEGRRLESVCPVSWKGVFAFVPGPDPTYARIENGRWPDEKPYCVLHRIASAPGVKGFADFCFRWSLSQYPVLRVDTHQDNRPMLHLLEKNGFVRCGIIRVADGSPRVAFQKNADTGE